MKMYQVYVCEACGFESRDHDEAELCEAKHMGLQTLKDKHTYDALKSYAQYCGSVVANTKNDKTEAAFDDAIQKLIAFEKEHGVIK